MTGKDWLSRFLFCHTPREIKPDGRPLYAYKCRDKDYEAIKGLLRDWLVLKPSRYLDPCFNPVFCLYAAETFRREHADGVWAWDTVFNPLGMEKPDQSHIMEWVEAGLRWWQRDLLIDRNKHRRFLVTIACEGGLPLRLLHKQDTNLWRFFVALLKEYHLQGKGGPDAAEAIAGQQAIKFLPPSLCRDVVFRLGGELIAKITDLQQTIGEAANPIAALDEHNPRWRNELPLSAEDQTVGALLGGLVRRSGELARASKAGMGWRGRLKRSDTGFIVEKHLEFPDFLTAPQMQASTGRRDLPARLHLILHTPHGGEAVARLTLNGGADNTAVFRREWLRRGGVKLVGASVQQWHRIVLHDSDMEHGVSIRGGETWEKELPWIFVAHNEADGWEWLAEGSAKTRAAEAWVLVPREFVAQPIDGISCDSIGEIAELGRMIYSVIGRVDFIAPDQGRYRVECRAEADSACSYSIWGEKVPEALNETPLYRGLPRIESVDAEGRRQIESGMLQQWKSVGVQSEWRQSAISGTGMLWLRSLDRETGIEKFRRQVAVLPRQLRIERDIGHTTVPGCYRLSGLEGFKAWVVSPQQAKLEFGPEEDLIRIECPVLSAAALPILQLAFTWNGGNRVEVQLLYPQRGASFRLGGKVLSQGDWVSLDRLGGLRVLVQDHAGSSRFWLDVRLILETKNEGERILGGFRHRMPILRDGQLDFGLYDWHGRIASLLASSPQLDARVRLEIASSHQEILASIYIARFDATLEPNWEQACADITADSLSRLDQGWEDRVTLEMIRLWAPCEAPVMLGACSDRHSSWRVPTDLEIGPWWVVGRDAGWARFRPLLWTVRAKGEPAQETDPTSALVQAIRHSQQERERLFPLVLAELGDDPDHADWPLLFDYFKLTAEFPPNALDVLCRLTKHPRTMAMALIKADEESFERVWALAECMPFSWGLVSIHDWEHAASRYFCGLLTVLAEIETGDEIVWDIFQRFREQTLAKRNYWRPLCDWLQERLFPHRPAPQNSELHMARRAATHVESEIAYAQQELQGRHDGQEQWPASAQVKAISDSVDFPCISRFMRLPTDFQPVHFAPFVVAHLSLKGSRPSKILIYELRLLRHFDPEWFDTAYAMALTLGLAALLPGTAL